MKQGKYKVEFLKQEYPLYYIKEANEAQLWINRLMEQPDALWSGDTETMALSQFRDIDKAAMNPHYSRVRLLQIFTGRTGFVFDMDSCDYSQFKELLESRRWIFHNSLFDLQYLYKDFKVHTCNIGCTMLAAKLIFHASSPTDEGLSASLRNLVNIAFGEEILKEMQESDWSAPELTWEQVEYSALDAICTLKLAERLAPKLQSLGLNKVYSLYKEAQHPLCKMQLHGIGLNEPEHKKLTQKWMAEAADAELELKAKTGLDKITITTMANYLEENLDEQTLAIWPRSEKSNKLQTNADAFVMFSHLPVVKPFSRFQKASKLYQSFGQGLSDAINKVTGKLHPRYNIAGARTGRLSCTTPNLQQSPRDKDFRKLFVPAKGNVFVLADYSQIEVRVAAEYSKDPEMLRVYQEGKDIYRYTASQLNNVTEDKVTKDQRQGAKALVLGLLYGLGAKKFSFYAHKNYGVSISEAQAQKQVKDYRELYAGFRKWQNNQVEEVAKNNFIVTTRYGKRRKLDPEAAYGASLNTPIQGSSAEILLRALIRLEESNRGEFKLVANIHDEILLECKPEVAENVKAILERAMVMAYFDVFSEGKATKNLVEAHIGYSWAEAKG